MDEDEDVGYSAAELAGMKVRVGSVGWEWAYLDAQAAIILQCNKQ